MAIDFIDATTLRAKRYYNKKSINQLPSSPLALYSEARYLIIRLPSSQFMKIVYRLLLLLLALASFPMIIRSSFIEKISSSSAQQALHESIDQVNYDSVNMDQLLTILFRDLINEGLMKQQEHKAVFMNNNEQQGGFRVVSDYNMDLVPLNDLEKQNTVFDNTVDFVFTTDFPASSEFIERALKVDGVVTVLLNDNPSAVLYKPSNYKIAYMRRLDLIAVAMKKEELVPEIPSLAAPRKLCGYPSEAKKAALQNLEDVLLEPPRAASGKSRQYLKRTR